MIHVVTLITCHNRRETTTRCLESVGVQLGEGQDYELSIVLVDAGSDDGTAEAVESQFPKVTVVRAQTSVYWGAGMRLATRVAFQTYREFDYFLWLNDDVVLAPGAVTKMLATASARPGEPSIVVGQLTDSTGTATYGGYRRGRRPLELIPVGEQAEAARCDTMNGNVVLVPTDVSRRLGHIDRRFPHRMGDIDFGLRATRLGVSVIQAAGVIGTCALNTGTHVSGPTPWRRLRTATSVKFFPPRAWWTFCLRHGGALAPAYFVKPYLLALTVDSGAGEETASM